MKPADCIGCFCGVMNDITNSEEMLSAQFCIHEHDHDWSLTGNGEYYKRFRYIP